ncbi:MAG: FHA domain-containing protein [Deltaproteobacteria bacterium]|nr:FHA domain-containing protein [Deltaproteobacteria bacterium]
MAEPEGSDLLSSSTGVVDGTEVRDTGDPSSRATLVVLGGSANYNKLSLSMSAPVMIGRGAECALRLSDTGVSRHHAKVHYDSATESWFVTDLSSRNGTFLNGRPIKSASLGSGDYILLGTHALLIFTRFDPLDEQIQRARRMESIGALAGGIAHDFNNVLSIIMANVSYLTHRLRASPDLELMEVLGECEEAVKRGADLSREILRFSRAGEDLRVTLRLDRIAADMARLLRRITPRSIDIQVPDHGPVWILGRQSQLDQIVLNLGKNACDSMPDGGQLLIDVRNGDPGEVALSVVDTGPGMDEQTLSRIFEPYFTTKAAAGGSGIGLATVRRLCDELRATIDVRSVVGQGTRFDLRFARATEPSRQTLDNINTTAELTGWVLVVDPDPAVRRATCRMLSTVGYDGVPVSSAAELEATLRKRRGDFRWIMVDPQVTCGDPAKCLEILDRTAPGVGLLLISDLRIDTPPDPRIIGFLMKPFDRDHMKAVIATFDAFYLDAARARVERQLDPSTQ